MKWRIRAVKADALEGVESRVNNRMGGWQKTSTGEGYLEQANLRDAEVVGFGSSAGRGHRGR